MEIACAGFTETALLTGRGSGVFGFQVVEYPGHTAVDSDEERLRKTRENLLPGVIKALTVTPTIPEGAAATAGAAGDLEPGDIVFEGTYDEVNQYFYRKQWSDGLPITPPTLERVEQFLKYTDLSPDHSFGPLAPGYRESTVWSIAVNGVMSGCRPEYMPVLVAIVEVIADPRWRITQRGSTVSWEPFIILNGPLMEQLGYNSGQGMFRAGTQANTSTQRFMTMYLRNISGFRAKQSDKSCFGRNTFPLVFVEDETNNPWEPLSESYGGFKPGSNVVTVVSEQSMSKHYQPAASEPTLMLEKLAIILNIDLLDRGYLRLMDKERHDILCMSPIIANVVAQKYSKIQVQEYLFEHARIPVWQWNQRIFAESTGTTPETTETIDSLVNDGRLRKDLYGESEDPNRLVPSYWYPDELLILVGGDNLRNRCFAMGSNGENGGQATSKEVRLPENWKELVPRPLT